MINGLFNEIPEEEMVLTIGGNCGSGGGGYTIGGINFNCLGVGTVDTSGVKTSVSPYISISTPVGTVTFKNGEFSFSPGVNLGPVSVGVEGSVSR